MISYITRNVATQNFEPVWALQSHWLYTCSLNHSLRSWSRAIGLTFVHKAIGLALVHKTIGLTVLASQLTAPFASNLFTRPLATHLFTRPLGSQYWPHICWQRHWPHIWSLIHKAIGLTLVFTELHRASHLFTRPLASHLLKRLLPSHLLTRPSALQTCQCESTYDSNGKIIRFSARYSKSKSNKWWKHCIVCLLVHEISYIDWMS